jgi:RHH-type proline utilization regulon transcriptional repressor/proline dehydrogenase/delta 1-pyrroline-5-carboxylate dehydrogenase
MTASHIGTDDLTRKGRVTIAHHAETDDQNAMQVDGTALPEWVVLDTVGSALNSAGQRCLALRLLVVQEGVADRVIEWSRGYMECVQATLRFANRMSQVVIKPTSKRVSMRVAEALLRRSGPRGLEERT